jgi:hypothetical protein
MFAVVRQYGVVVLETQKFYASLLLLILQLQMLSGALLKSRKLTLLQTTMVVFTMKLLLNLSVYIRELLVLETCPYIGSFQKKSIPTEEISSIRRGRGEKIVSDNDKCIRTSDGVGGLTSYFLRGGGMDVFWNDLLDSLYK